MNKKHVSRVIDMAQSIHNRTQIDLSLSVLERVMLLSFTKGMLTTLSILIQNKEPDHALAVKEIKQILKEQGVS